MSCVLTKQVTAKDARRILHRWIESEEISKKIKTGLVSEQGAAVREGLFGVGHCHLAQQRLSNLLLL